MPVKMTIGGREIKGIGSYRLSTFTEKDLHLLPEIENVVLWQGEDGPTSVIDSWGITWMIGKYQGFLCKRRVR
jgi:hypothetical protein